MPNDNEKINGAPEADSNEKETKAAEKTPSAETAGEGKSGAAGETKKAPVRKKPAAAGTKKPAGNSGTAGKTVKKTAAAGTKKPSAAGAKKPAGTRTGAAGGAKKTVQGANGRRRVKKKVLNPSANEIKNSTRRFMEAMCFLFPWLIGLLLFFAYPMAQSVVLSFSQITKAYGFETELIGLANYTSILSDANYQEVFFESMKRTLIFVPSVVVISMILAVFLNTKMKLRGIFRSMFFLPVLLGSGYIVQQLLGQQIDPAAQEAGYTLMTSEMARGIVMPHQLEFLVPPELLTVIETIFQYITQILWKSGVQILIFLSGLQSISASVYESARVDGATEWETFWKITIPSVAPVTVLTIIYTIIDTTTDLTSPLISLMVTTSEDASAMGRAAAMSWVYLFTVLVMVGIVLFATRKVNDGVDN